jgi:hypothetical protein
MMFGAWGQQPTEVALDLVILDRTARSSAGININTADTSGGEQTLVRQ